MDPQVALALALLFGGSDSSSKESFPSTKIAASEKKLLTYHELLTRVKKGERLILGVGYVPREGLDGYIDYLPNGLQGIFDCYLENGVAVMKPHNMTTVTPEVVTQQPFRGIQYNSSHTCPTCGRNQFVISGRGPVPGSHTHTCPFDGTTWWHNDR